MTSFYLIVLKNADGSLCHCQWGDDAALVIEAHTAREAVEIAMSPRFTAPFVAADLAPWDERANGRRFLSAIETKIARVGA